MPVLSKVCSLRKISASQQKLCCSHFFMLVFIFYHFKVATQLGLTCLDFTFEYLRFNLIKDYTC